MKFKYILIFSLIFSFELFCSSQRKPKLLVLIIDSENLPVYKQLRKIWRSYMHYNPEQVESYFIRGNPNLSRSHIIENDIIWSKTQESYIPGILNKTILSLEAMIPRINDFDYILRTNLSSFYVFPRLLKVLNKSPRSRFILSGGFVSPFDNSLKCPHGCGYIISRDLAELIIKNKSQILTSPQANAWPDDVVTCEFFYKNNLHKINDKKIDLSSISSWKKIKHKIPKKAFHFRVRNFNPKIRIKNEVYIQRKLLQRFYKNQVRS